MKFKEMKIGDVVEFYALLEDLKLRHTPNQTSYYSANISDGIQTVDARIWDVHLKENLEIGKVYKFNAKVNEYGGKMQVVITAINDILDGEVELTDFFRSAPMKEAELRSCINEYIRKITNKTLKELVVYLIKQVEKKYFTYPAAVTMHHNFLQGLVYHTYSMLRLADRVIENYPVINKSLLYSGILVHDIGKTVELTKEVSPVYSMEGTMLGHLVIGMNMIRVAASELHISDTEEVQMLLHLVASHHGDLEYGSPKEPNTIEALALHLIDLMDSKLAGVTQEVELTQKGEFTQPIGLLGRKALYVTKIEE